jgi:chemotaxis protein methyltransferase CheR
MATADGRSFDRLLEHIERALGFQTSSYNDAYLDRRISARMRRNDLDDYSSYQRLLESDEAEQQELLDTLSVNVTSFFRNPDVWEALRPVLRELTANGRTKVWSAACSDGREAYSLAMLAHDDPQVREDRISITGTDIKREILRAATAGEYNASETNDLETQLEPIGDYERYITREDDRYCVSRELKRMTDFRRHDLIRQSPPDQFDLILCRNLFIYVDADAKRAVFETLGSGLEPDGYLTIGMTETVPSDCRSWFEPVEKRLRIYRNAR